MEATFWHQKWEHGEIAFHQAETNPFLTTYFDKLNLAKGSRVFLPLCGKTRDFAWLLLSGYRVVGAELSELAIEALFKDLDLAPTITKIGKLIHYSAQDIDVYVGDIFDLSTEYIGPVDAIYDRAALVALPASIRTQYTAHLMQITAAVPQLLIAYEYDQLLIDGPPFSVSEDEIKQHYATTYQLSPLESKEIAGGLKGKVAAKETIWLLSKAK